jgi:hypothetical protein
MKKRDLPKIYPSRYTDRKADAAQILAEIMCERMAQKDKVALQPKFWSTDRWRKIYAQQLRFAYSLLQLYEPAVVSHVLRVGQGKIAYSLGAPFLDALFAGEQESRKQKQAIAEVKAAEREKEKREEPVVDNTPLPASRPEFVDKPKNNLLSKLRGLDGKKES